MAQETERAERLEREVLWEKLNNVIGQHHGLAKTSVLKEAGISYKTILTLVERGELIRVKSGYYSLPESEFSEEEMIVSQYPDGVLTMDTALFYHGYIDERPQVWSIAVSKNISKSRFKLKIPPVKPYFTEDKVLEMGVEDITLAGETVKIFTVDRLICDVMRYRDRLEAETFRQAIRAYLEDDSKDVGLLMEYAQSRRVLQKIETILGTWMAIPEIRKKPVKSSLKTKEMPERGAGETAGSAAQAARNMAGEPLAAATAPGAAKEAAVAAMPAKAEGSMVGAVEISAQPMESQPMGAPAGLPGDVVPAQEGQMETSETPRVRKRSYTSLKKQTGETSEQKAPSRRQQALNVLKESREYGKNKTEPQAVDIASGSTQTAAQTIQGGSITPQPRAAAAVSPQTIAPQVTAQQPQAIEPPQHQASAPQVIEPPQHQASAPQAIEPLQHQAPAPQVPVMRSYRSAFAQRDADTEAARGMLRNALAEAGAAIEETGVSPSEIASDIFEILLRMELLEDMGILLKLYHILCNHTVDGLTVSRHLSEICEEDDFIPNEARVKKLNGWVVDRFMEQKWDKFKKRQENLSISWTDVSQKLAAFIVPIGLSLVEETFYTGEWMPKIARFIG